MGSSLSLDVGYHFGGFQCTPRMMVVQQLVAVLIFSQEEIRALLHHLEPEASMYHICISHSSVNGHLGSFYILNIVHNAGMNIGVHMSS